MALWFASNLQLIAIPEWLRPRNMEPPVLAALIPAIYVLGMLVDFLSILTTKFLANLIDGHWHPKIADKIRLQLPVSLKWLLPERTTYDQTIGTAELFEKSERLTLTELQEEHFLSSVFSPVFSYGEP